MRTIFYLDLDAFFVSVERILDPTLNDQPVIVGADPNGMGVVAACSYEARKYGIHSAMPIRTAYRLCPHGKYIHGHYDEYVHFSHGVKTILSNYAPILEQSSIDEFSMDFTGCEKMYGSLFQFASFLQKEILDKLFLPCSIGIGTNKTIAKIASDCMKPKGITYVVAGQEKEFLAPMPIETIPGVGKVTQMELNTRGFYIIQDIQKSTSRYFEIAFGKFGLDIWRKAHGEGTEYLTIEREQKSISKEVTFSKDMLSKETMKDVLFDCTGKVCQQMRDDKVRAATISIKLRYSDFQTLTRARTITPTDEDLKIFETAWELMEKTYTRRVAVRLIGISLSKFSNQAEQEYLFEDFDTKRKKVLSAINGLRAKYGFEVIQIGKA